jgi:hypothetical protein
MPLILQDSEIPPYCPHLNSATFAASSGVALLQVVENFAKNRRVLRVATG